MAGALAAGAWRYATQPPAPPLHATVSFLDVGQGDATLVQDGHGAAALFDGGPPEARVYRLLRAAGVDHLDLMVATHQSRDHQGGLAEVLDRIPTDTLLENGDGTRDPGFQALLADADRHGVRRVPARAGQVLRVGRMTIRIPRPRRDHLDRLRTTRTSAPSPPSSQRAPSTCSSRPTQRVRHSCRSTCPPSRR
jgi:competence protein ComEC